MNRHRVAIAIITGTVALSAAGAGSAAAATHNSPAAHLTSGQRAGRAGSAIKVATVHTATAKVNGRSETVLVNARGLPLYYYQLDTAKKSLVTGELAPALAPTAGGATDRDGGYGQTNGREGREWPTSRLQRSFPLYVRRRRPPAGQRPRGAGFLHCHSEPEGDRQCAAAPGYDRHDAGKLRLLKASGSEVPKSSKPCAPSGPRPPLRRVWTNSPDLYECTRAKEHGDALVGFFEVVNAVRAETGDLVQGRTRSRMTQRHFAIMRSRSKPNSSNRLVGPVWK